MRCETCATLPARSSIRPSRPRGSFCCGKLGEGALDLGELRVVGCALRFGQCRADAGGARLELTAQLCDLALLRGERSRGGGDRPRHGLDAVGHDADAVGDDVDAVRHALLELGVALRDRFDGLPELLKGLLVDRHRRLQVGVQLVHACEQRLDEARTGAASRVRVHVCSGRSRSERGRSLRRVAVASGCDPSTRVDWCPAGLRT